MTAPAPVSAPAPVDASSLEGMMDRFTSEEFIGEVVRDYAAGKEDPHKMVPSTTELATIGDFGDANAKPDAKPAATVAKPADAATVAAKPADAPVVPAKLATEFKLIGADGDELDVPDVMAKVAKVAFTYKGEVRELPLDRVVRLAQSGIHNEDLYTKATEAIGHFDTIERELETVSGKLTKQNTFIERLLTDEDFRLQVTEDWQRQNTPEARADRAERELKALRQERAGQSTHADGASFFQNDVAPALKALLTQFPTLTQEEVIGRFNIVTAKFGATIGGQHFQDVRAILRDDLPAWAAGLHETRAAQGTATRKAKEETTLLKRRVAQGARPTGRRATAEELKAKPRTARTEDERLDQMLDKVLAG